MIRSTTSLSAGWPVTLLSYDRKTSHFPSGEGCGNQSANSVRRDLFLFAAVGIHSPDLHHAGSFGVEINVLAVRRVVGAVVQAVGGCEPFLFAAWSAIV